MTTRKDLEAEYQKDTGKYANSSSTTEIHCICPNQKCGHEFEQEVETYDEFLDWLINKHIELRDTKMEIDNG